MHSRPNSSSTDADFFGINGAMCWWHGVVENRIDPEKHGRVQVRLLGLHAEEKIINEKTAQGIPTEDLPWAWPMRPITSAAMDGIGQTPLGLVEGSHVFGFSRDGRAMNDLVVIGSFGGTPIDPPDDEDGQKGFVDPRTAGEIAASPRKINQEEGRDPGYPPQGIPMGRYPQEKFLDEPDMNRLARAEKLDETYLETRKEERRRGIQTPKSSWDEKGSAYGAVYPYNHVRESECGHVIELDDSPGAERLNIWLFSKSFFESDKDGNTQSKFTGDHFHIVEKDLRAYSDQEISITSNGDTLVKTLEGEFVLEAQSNVEVKTLTGDMKLNSLTGEMEIMSMRTMSLNSKRDININATTQISITSVGGIINIASTQPINISSAVSVNVFSPLFLYNGSQVATT